MVLNGHSKSFPGLSHALEQGKDERPWLVYPESGVNVLHHIHGVPQEPRSHRDLRGRWRSGGVWGAVATGHRPTLTEGEASESAVNGPDHRGRPRGVSPG